MMRARERERERIYWILSNDDWIHLGSEDAVRVGEHVHFKVVYLSHFSSSSSIRLCYFVSPPPPFLMSAFSNMNLYTLGPNDNSRRERER